ncbi:MAG: hypothetical protein HY293_11750 [Planctomycetes bacterium]|nr:hypothetical protein [Planctomycetota bacterium]
MARRFDPVAYLKLFRFPLVFTAIADSAAGCLITGRGDYFEKAGLLAVSSAGLYFFGMALNDVADVEKDKSAAPGRVLPSGRLSLRAARWAMVLALIASGCAVLGLGYQYLVQRLVVWGATAFFIVAYNVFLKFPPVMGCVRVCNLLLGISASSPLNMDGAADFRIIALVLAPTLVYVSSLTYVSTLEDVGADRRKLGVGAALMALAAQAAAIALSLSLSIDGRSAATGAPNVHSVVGDLLGRWQGTLYASVLAAWILRRAWGARDKKGIMLFVRDGVGGIILLDAALVASLDGFNTALWVAWLVIPAAISVVIFKRLA